MSDDQDRIHEAEVEIKRDTCYLRWGIFAAIAITAAAFFYFISQSHDKTATKTDAPLVADKSPISDVKLTFEKFSVYLDRDSKLIVSVFVSAQADLTSDDEFRLMAKPLDDECAVRQAMNTLRPNEQEVKLKLQYLPQGDEIECVSKKLEFSATHYKGGAYQGSVPLKTVRYDKTWKK